MVAEGTQPVEERSSGSGSDAGTGGVPARRGRLGLLLRALAALASGLAQLAALPPYGLWVLAPLSAALLLWAVHGVRARRAAWLGLLAGAALMVPLIKWQEVFGADVWLVIAAAETVYFVPMAMGIALVSRLPGWVVWTSALWVAQEFVRARFPLGGFPWGKLAFSQPDTVFTGYAALGSSALVTFTVALTGALLVAAVRAVARARRGGDPAGGVRSLANHLVVILAVAVAGAFAPAIGAPERDHTATVALVQGNVPGVGEMNILGERMQVLTNHVEGVHELAERVRAGEVDQPDLVVLPENASDIDTYADPAAAELIQQAAEDVGAPLLFGITRYSEDGTQRWIRSVVWDPEDGPGEYYTKRYLVPFGEYVPFRDFFASIVSRLEQVGSDAVPGTEPGALRMGDTTVATAICFDVAFDRPVRESVAAGGQIIAVPTNNANYNFTGQSDQQLAITQLRAVEHGRPAVVASTSGVSAVVATDGTVTYRSPEAEPAVHVAQVPAMAGLTPATRLGVFPEAVLTLLGVGAVAAAVALERRSRRPGPRLWAKGS
ncbi:apolipoprotein N-acyltransferase [Spinactinospora alkalitolerans]|uniref:Apolipoprotein N-acyltransferase n=1 Tax=Spinactinospora alkalitolerans TaxID=687207 RepID=A0A852TY88_9ACTN|nr:apolipoprotein N-acyltransferase [Spinactinospora alkalitolerans]NYE46974.1 apolipoprotein N-acyltransferase [Spinactinospora alkalitolerans]